MQIKNSGGLGLGSGGRGGGGGGGGAAVKEGLHWLVLKGSACSLQLLLLCDRDPVSEDSSSASQLSCKLFSEMELLSNLQQNVRFLAS